MVACLLEIALTVRFHRSGGDAVKEFVAGQFAALLTGELAAVVLRLEKGNAKSPGSEIARRIEGLALFPKHEAGLLREIVGRGPASRERNEKGKEARTMRFDENLDLGGRVIFQRFHRGMSLRGVIVPACPMITNYF